MKPLYFMFGKFFGCNDTIEASGTKDFKTEDGKVTVNATNVQPYTKLGIPMSQIAAHVSGVQFLDNIEELGESIAYFNVATTPDMDFVVGYINDKKYDDARDFMNDLHNFKIIVGFNCFKFDLALLRKWFPQDFYYQKINDFEIPIVPRTLVIDLYFFYRLWKPYNDTHSLSHLAEDIGFKEDRLDHDSDKDARCAQDIRVMMSAFEIVPPIFRMLGELINADWYFLQNSYFTKLRKYVIFKYLLNKGFLPTQFPENHEIKSVPKPALFAKRGVYEDCWMYDIKNAYPSTAASLDLSLFIKNDFTEIQKQLIEYRDEAKSTVKFIANAMVGDQRDRNNHVRDERIWNDIVGTCSARVMGLVERLKPNVVFSHTDCVVLEKDLKPKLPNYQLDLKHHFEWLVVYNHTRYLGLDHDTGEVVRAGFSQELRVKLFDLINERVDKELKKSNFRILEDRGGKKGCGDAFDVLIPWLEDLDPSYFSIKIYKKDDICREEKYWEIWDSLKMGFNEVFVLSTGYTTNFEDVKKDNYKAYLSKVYPFVRSYVVFDRRGVEERRRNQC